MGYTESGDLSDREAVLSKMHDRCRHAAIPFNFDGARVLEVGGAGGVLGGLISSTAKKIIVSDIIDVQVQYGGQFPKLLKEKFERNGKSLDLSRIEFHTADAMELPYRDGLFVLFCQTTPSSISRTRFRHCTQREVLRVLKTGGVAYVTFDPIWTADTGSHFIHCVKEPWAHLVQSTDEFASNMRNAGAAEWEVSDFIHSLNRVPCREYKKRLQEVLGSAGLKRYAIDSWSGCVRKEFVKYEISFNEKR